MGNGGIFDTMTDSILEGVYSAWQAMTWWEAAGVFFGLLYIFLAARENSWCWGAGLISVLIYVKICWEARLLAELGLQGFYLIITAYGWYQWKWGFKKKELPIGQLSLPQHVWLISGGLLASALMGWLLTRYTEASLPYIDSFTTVFSMITTWMVARKKIENWLYWIVVDGVAVYMYWSKALYLTALLFVAYVIIVIIGYFEWKKHLIVQNAHE